LARTLLKQPGMTKLMLSAVAAVVVAAAAPTPARADHLARYAGMHPIAAEYGGGFCYIEYPHVHVYDPQKPDVLYRQTDDGYYFVGDPVPYGYEGPKHAYYGPHPIQDELGDVEYCYIDGPHYHSLPPPVTVAASFKLKGGVYFYDGHFPQVYYDARPRYARINAVYRPLVYARPVVVAGPEAAVVVETPPPPAVVVSPPQAGVAVEAGVGIHAGVGVGIGGGVIVGAPPPVVVVGRPAPPPVVVVEERRPRTIIVEDRRPVEVIRVKEKHHDHDDEDGNHQGRGRGHAWGRGW